MIFVCVWVPHDFGVKAEEAFHAPLAMPFTQFQLIAELSYLHSYCLIKADITDLHVLLMYFRLIRRCTTCTKRSLKIFKNPRNFLLSFLENIAHQRSLSSLIHSRKLRCFDSEHSDQLQLSLFLFWSNSTKHQTISPSQMIRPSPNIAQEISSHGATWPRLRNSQCLHCFFGFHKIFHYCKQLDRRECFTRRNISKALFSHLFRTNTAFPHSSRRPSWSSLLS